MALFLSSSDDTVGCFLLANLRSSYRFDTMSMMPLEGVRRIDRGHMLSNA